MAIAFRSMAKNISAIIYAGRARKKILMNTQQIWENTKDLTSTQQM